MAANHLSINFIITFQSKVSFNLIFIKFFYCYFNICLLLIAESGQYVNQERYHHDDDDDDEELEREAGGVDQPLDFSAKKPEITAKVAVGLTNGHHFTGQSWSHHLPGVVTAVSHSSESGVSDLCSNSPQSDTAEPPVPAKSPIENSASPIHQQSNVIQQSRVNQIPSPLPAALSAIYGPLAALQQQQQLQQQMQQQNGRNGMSGIDPAISAATTQLLSNLAAVTNGGKGGKNTRPFKGKRYCYKTRNNNK